MKNSNILKTKKEQELISSNNLFEEIEDDWFCRDLSKELMEEEA